MAIEPGPFLARSRKLKHPSGVLLTTPLLVPSFSSKGFPSAGGSETWIRKAMATTAEWLTDTMLVSAYDLHYGEILGPGDLSCMPELTIVDSGGYEAGFDSDLATPVMRRHAPREWTSELLAQAYGAWPAEFPAIFVSFDHPNHRKPLADQVADAKSLLAPFPRQLHSILLKPETKTQTYLKETLDAAIADPRCLADFDVVGVTEKELGTDFLQRMQRIARLRIAMDKEGVDAPLQVFGALDPITSCLYFIAGAEIFDGLTWLRYAYHEGMCVYRANYGAMRIGLDRRDVLVDAHRCHEADFRKTSRRPRRGYDGKSTQ